MPSNNSVEQPLGIRPVRGDQAHPRIRRPFLTPTGRNVRNTAAAAAITWALVTAGGGSPQGSQQPGAYDNSSPRPVSGRVETQGTTPTEKPAVEIKPDIIRVSDLRPDNPIMEKLNGKVMIIIDQEDNLPVPRTSTSVSDSGDNASSWLQISELNGQSITQALDSNRKIELVLTDPLVYRNKSGIGMWVVGVGADKKPLYVLAGQETAGKVMVEPRGGKEPVFGDVSPDANVYDYGHVSFQNTPSNTSSQ